MGALYLHNNMTGGEISPSLHSRVGIDKYEASVARAENVVISPFGGLKRRGGLNKHEGAYVGVNEARIEKFEASAAESYVLVFAVGQVQVYLQGKTLKATVAMPQITTLAELRDFDIVQYLDTAIIVHESFAPVSLVRNALDDTDWSLQTIAIQASKYAFDNTPRPDAKWVNTGEPLEINTIAVGDVVYNIDGNNVNGTDETYYRAKVTRTSVRLDNENFANTTNYDVVAWGEAVFSATRGYPSTACFFGQRLWLAGTKALGTAVFGSKINAYFDFRLGTGAEDFGVFDIIETGDYNKIVNINAGRSLQVYTTNREFINTSVYITPTDSGWKEQTGYGSKRIRPINIDGSSLYVDSSGKSIRSLIYSLDEDGYISPTASLTASHLINDPISMSAVKGTLNDVSDFVYVVNADGKVAVWNTNRLENISGWTEFTTQGEFKDVVVINESVFFLVKRNGSFYVEKLDDSLYTDHASVNIGSAANFDNVTHDANDVVNLGDDVIHTAVLNAGTISSITTNIEGNAGLMPMAVTYDFNVQENVTVNDTSGTNSITLTRPALRAEIGLAFTSTITTLPEAPDTKGGNYINKKKRFGEVIIDYLDTIGGAVNQVQSQTRQLITPLDASLEPFTGVKSFRFLGYARRLDITLTQEQPLPFYIRSIELEVIY